MEQNGEVLIKIMAGKTHDAAGINAAFGLFCAKYEIRLLKLVEVQCVKLGYSAEYAYKAIECTFARVLRYPTFDMNKSRCKDIDNAIIKWLNQIAFTQILKFKNNGECAEVTLEEDLSVVTNASDFYKIVTEHSYIPENEKKDKIRMLDEKLSNIDEKHRIVLLTYLAYGSYYKSLPRSLLLRLRHVLNLKQSSIRAYKKEAFESLKYNTKESENGQS